MRVAPWLRDLWGMEPPRWTHNSYRPFTVLTLRANYAMSGHTAWSYHGTNVVVHGAVCLAALWLLRCVMGGRRGGHAVLAAALFAAHPVHTEVVANVASRAETLSGGLTLAAMAVYLGCTDPGVPRAHTTTVLLACALLTTAAVLCKETGLVTPAMLMCVEALRSVAQFLAVWHGRAVPPAQAAAPAPVAAPAPGPPATPAPAPPPPGLLGAVRAWFAWPPTLGTLARLGVLAALQCGLLYARVAVLSSGFKMPPVVMSNPLLGVQDPVLKALSVAVVQVK
jgi:hypothetical protein